MGRFIFLFFLFISGFNSLQAQEVPVTAGGDSSGSGGSASYTAGQVVFTAIESAAGIAAQGIQQAFIITEEATDAGYERLNLICEVYPNPTSGFLRLKLHHHLLTESTDYYYALSDMNGNLMEKKQISGNETLIDMSRLVPAIYFLQVSSAGKGQNMQATFKIIKQ